MPIRRRLTFGETSTVLLLIFVGIACTAAAVHGHSVVMGVAATAAFLTAPGLVLALTVPGDDDTTDQDAPE